MTKPKIKQLHDQIWLLSYDKQEDLTMNFLTFQEFYESPNPKFRNNPDFDILAFVDWYTKEHDGLFTYSVDWSGFNLPGWVFDAVKSENFYTKKIKKIVEKKIKPFLPSPDSKFYIIGCLKDDESTLDHELAHAFYYISDAYKAKADSFLAVYDNVFQDLKKALVIMGYTEEVCMDESQAYLSTGTVENIDVFFDTNQTLGVKDCIEQMEKNFKTFKQQIIKI